MTPNIGLKDRGIGGKGVRGKGTSRFIKNDYGKVPELKVSKIMEKYRHLGKSLEKRAKNHRIIFLPRLDSRALCKIEARGRGLKG